MMRLAGYIFARLRASFNGEIDRSWIKYAPPSTYYDLLAIRLLGISDLKPHVLVLDCGAGNGRFSIWLAQSYKNVRVVSLELNKRMISEQKRMRKLKRLNDRIEIVMADMMHLPFRKKVFDSILNIHNLWYVPDYARVCSEMIRVCKGIIVLDHYNLINPRNFLFLVGHVFKTLSLGVIKRQTFPLYYRTPKTIFSPFTGLTVETYQSKNLGLLSPRFLLRIKVT